MLIGILITTAGISLLTLALVGASIEVQRFAVRLVHNLTGGTWMPNRKTCREGNGHRRARHTEEMVLWVNVTASHSSLTPFENTP